MRKWRNRGLLAAILVMTLLACWGFGAAAAETEDTDIQSYSVDTETEVYKICDQLAENMEARHILVYDATSDTILYSKTVEGGKLYPASITKLFSAYVALQYLDPEDIVTAGDELELVQAGSSKAYIYKGQKVTVQMAVEAMMLPSGNDAAMIVAAAAGRRIAGDASLSGADAVQAFVKEMNRKAEELGFEKSHFANPDGYHVGAHYTSVNDMARIAGLALGNETIRRNMRIFQDDVTYASGQTNHWENTNLLLNPNREFYRADAIGMKTGHTRQAGFSLMSAVEDGERTLVIGVFGYTDELTRFEDTITLLKACKGELKVEIG